MATPGPGARSSPPVRGAKTLGEVFFGDYVFHMPDYQRDVVWTADHALELLDDVLGPLVTADAAPGVVPTYLNGITLHLDPATGNGHDSDDAAWLDFGPAPLRPAPRAGPVVQVVDGQQRLTTLTILVCCLRDRIDDPALRSALHGMVALSTATATDGAEPTPIQDADGAGYILKARGAAGRFMACHVQPMGATLGRVATDRADERATRNLAAIRDGLGAAIDRLDGATRASFVRRLREDCYLSMVVVTDPGREWRLFSRLNESGQRLQRSDRLKADLLGPVAADERPALVALWDGHKALIGDDFDGEGARKYLFSYVADLACPGRGSITERIMTRANETGHAAFIRDVFDPIATAYGQVVRARYDQGTPEESARISHLLAMLALVGRWLGQTVFSSEERGDAEGGTRLTPDHLMMPLLRWLAQNRSDPARTVRFLAGLDRLVHGLLVHHGASHHVADRLTRIADDLANAREEVDLDTLLALAVHGIRRKIESSLAGHVAKLVLVRLDAELEPASGRDAARLLSMRFDVEHVLPQSLPKAWLRLFPNRIEARRHVQKIGNKFVIERRGNRIAGERAWEQKRLVYAETGVLVPLRSALETPAWNAEAIERRTRDLMDVADRIWAFEDRPRRPPPPPRDKPRPVTAEPASRPKGPAGRVGGETVRPAAPAGPGSRPAARRSKRRRRSRYPPKVTGHR